jgi:hypothetical protein
MQSNKANKVKKARPGSTGSKHWNYQHGNETLAAKQERSERSLRLHYLQEIGLQLSFMGGRRMPGRKPNEYLKLNMNNKEELVVSLKKIEGK